MKKLIPYLSAALIAAGLNYGLYVYAQSTTAQKAAALPQLKFGDPLPGNLFIELSRIINPAVVNISTSVMSRRGSQMRDPMLDMLERFYGFPQGGQQDQSLRQVGLGTGFIIREDGLILTNNHVIENADQIGVQLTEKAEKIYEAKLIGSDKRTDIALIKITPEGKLPVASLGSSKDVEVGEWVAAFGNPFGHGHTMTKGIISSKGREIGEINKIPLLQTDASINPGNSGGPLVNTKGYVIGVNSAIDARAQGIGFAIPIDEVKALIPQLEQKGRIQRGYIGAALADLDPQAAEYMGLNEETAGAVITNLDPKGPAAKGGLRPYDIITSFGDRKIRTSTDLIDAVSDAPIGKEAKLKVMRGQKVITVNVKVADRPDERAPSRDGSKKYAGQKAPYNFGFTLVDPTDELRAEWGYPQELKNPVIIQIERDSIAARGGLRVGDIILDVNKKSADNAKDAVKAIKKDANTFRVARSGRIVIITITK